MKRVLFYCPRPGPGLLTERAEQTGFYVELASTLSQVFAKQLFRTGPSVDGCRFDVFLAQVDEPSKEIVDFMRYIGKYCPSLSLVVMSGSREVLVSLTNRLKDTGCRVLESNYLESALDEL